MNLALNAVKREVTTYGGLKALRAKAAIPGVVYSHGKENHLITVPSREFSLVLTKAGTSNLIDLNIEGMKSALPVLISEVQRDPMTGAVIHVDLHEVRMDEKLRTEIQLAFIGESPAVKSLGGNLIISIDAWNVECFPKDLVSSTQVDISVHEKLDITLQISDLKIPAGITVLDDAHGNVVSVLAPRAEEEQPTPETTVVGAEEAAATAEGEAVDGADAAAGADAKKEAKK